MIYGLVGKYLRHSRSKEIFEEGIWGSSTEHTFRYIQTDDLGEAIRSLRSDDQWGGLMVTTPYKEQVIPLLDHLTPDAEALGAVNCIRRLTDGILWGTNTDWQGFQHSLHLHSVSRALVLGTGGAAKSVAYALRALGVDTYVVSRSSRGDLTYDHLRETGLGAYDLIVNATPLGTARLPQEKPPLPYDTLRLDAHLYDLNYNPAITLFLLEGLQRGTSAQNGMQMLIHQARVAWDFFQKDPTRLHRSK